MERRIRKATPEDKLSYGEFNMFKRFITELYPEGFCSIVSDTWDLWKVVTDYVPRLKDTIMARNGRLVIRPDSGDPVEIITGVKERNIFEAPNGDKYYVEDYYSDVQFMEEVGHLYEKDPEKFPYKKLTEEEFKGVYQILWETFGGRVNENGYKILDTHIGVIYGDSITLERQKEIYRRLEEKGFAATNLVLGIGSYTYQYRTRDSLGFAMKATWCQINGEPREIFKNPKTDTGMKKSLKGLISVRFTPRGYEAVDQVTPEEENTGCLKPVFENGKLLVEVSLSEIRERLCKF